MGRERSVSGLGEPFRTAARYYMSENSAERCERSRSAIMAAVGRDIWKKSGAAKQIVLPMHTNNEIKKDASGKEVSGIKRDEMIAGFILGQAINSTAANRHAFTRDGAKSEKRRRLITLS